MIVANYITLCIPFLQSAQDYFDASLHPQKWRSNSKCEICGGVAAIDVTMGKMARERFAEFRARRKPK